MRGRLLVALFVLGLIGVGAAVAGANRNWSVHANGGQEVPARDSRGQAQAIFHLSQDGSELEYKLVAANIENVFMAHIHMAPRGVSGPIVVWLYPSTTPGIMAPLGGGRIDGVIVQGSFGASDLVGPLAGHPLSELVDLMRSGGVYTNVHTNDGDLVVNEGPGDFPAGEIRGQIKENGPS